MRKRESRGLQILCARNDQGNFAAMAVDPDPDSPQFGDVIYAYIDNRGGTIRRCDAGEFLYTSIKCDDVQLRVFRNITEWSWPVWEVFAYKIDELHTTYFVARPKTGSSRHQYGRLVIHSGAQSSGQELPKHECLVYHRRIIDLAGEMTYRQQCKEGYSIDTVVESLPTFTPISYWGWMKAVREIGAVPWTQVENMAQCQMMAGTMVPHPPQEFGRSTGEWQMAVEAVIGQRLDRPYTHIEVPLRAYLEICKTCFIDTAKMIGKEIQLL